jgi:hypothetical protein
VITDLSLTSNETSTISPTHKKGNHESSPTKKDNNNTILRTYSQVTSSTSSNDKSQPQSIVPTSNRIIPSIDTSPTAASTSTLTVDNDGNDTQAEATTPTITNANNFTNALTFVDTSTAALTMSTMSTDNRMLVTTQPSDLTQLMEKQIKDLTSAMSIKYESTIQQMQETHIAQMNKIITKQKKHELDIEHLQCSQLKIKESLEEKMENKIEQQTNLLSSLVSMIHKMKGDKDSNISVQTNESKQASTKIDTTAISQGDMTDCSYSEEEDIISSPP